MPSWFERTDLNFLLDLEGLTEKRLVGALDSLEALDAETWQRRLFEGLCRQYRPPESFTMSPTPISMAATVRWLNPGTTRTRSRVAP